MHGLSHDQSMAYVGKTPWHQLGVPVEDNLTSEEFLKAADLDWEVELAPVTTTIPGTSVPIQVGWSAYRSDTLKMLSKYVGEDYKVVQNREAFEILERITDGKIKWETAGHVFGGRIVWVLGSTDPMYIGDEDRVNNYFLFTTSHDRSRALTLGYTPIRVVCYNTLSYATQRLSSSYTTTHKGDVHSRLISAGKILYTVETRKREAKKSFDKFFALSIDYDDRASYFHDTAEYFYKGLNN